VRIRSSDAVAVIRPAGADREAEISRIPASAGSHVSVCCKLGRVTREQDHNFPLLNH
jgi:hypothetical protein